jgi:uncharacterized protein (DUF952 family)
VIATFVSGDVSDPEQNRGSYVTPEPETIILHLTPRVDWETAQRAGAYRADTLEAEGFVHCSKSDQVVRVAEAYFAGRHGLVLLVLDPAQLMSEVRWEPGTDKPDELFPHVYGPINLEAVRDVLPFEPDPEGCFVLPPSLR